MSTRHLLLVVAEVEESSEPQLVVATTVPVQLLLVLLLLWQTVLAAWKLDYEIVTINSLKNDKNKFPYCLSNSSSGMPKFSNLVLWRLLFAATALQSLRTASASVR